MGFPKVRFIDVIPVKHQGQQMYLIRDPEDITDQSLVVSRDVLFILSLMDGTRSIKDLQEEYFRAFGNSIQTEQIQSMIDGMDNNLLLLNERYETHVTALMESYASQSCRPSFLAGRSFPAQEDELKKMLSDVLRNRDGVDLPGPLRGLLAPHIDYGRGKKVYADAYAYLSHMEQDLIVIFGTCHKFAPKLWNISLKDWATPLGTLKNAGGLSVLIKENSVLNGCVSEWCHRNEHSIELQLPIIQFLIGDREIEILPILNGSMHQFVSGQKKLDDPEVTELTENLRDVLDRYGKSYLVIAAADLAHIGAQFGDQFRCDASTLDQSKNSDRLILDQIENADAEGFFQVVREEGDSRRICGLAPIFFQLSLLKSSRVKLAGYDQWTDGASSVSFAGAAFFD